MTSQSCSKLVTNTLSFRRWCKIVLTFLNWLSFSHRQVHLGWTPGSPCLWSNFLLLLFHCSPGTILPLSLVAKAQDSCASFQVPGYFFKSPNWEQREELHLPQSGASTRQIDLYHNFEELSCEGTLPARY